MRESGCKQRWSTTSLSRRFYSSQNLQLLSLSAARCLSSVTAGSGLAEPEAESLCYSACSIPKLVRLKLKIRATSRTGAWSMELQRRRTSVSPAHLEIAVILLEQRLEERGWWWRVRQHPYLHSSRQTMKDQVTNEFVGMQLFFTVKYWLWSSKIPHSSLFQRITS